MVSTPKCSPKSVCSRVAAVLQRKLLVDGQIGVVVGGEGHGAVGHGVTPISAWRMLVRRW